MKGRIRPQVRKQFNSDDDLTTASAKVSELTHISHRPLATSTDLPVPAGRAPKFVLDRLQARLRAIFVCAPSIHGHLDAFAANDGEKCGLTAVVRFKYRWGLFQKTSPHVSWLWLLGWAAAAGLAACGGANDQDGHLAGNGLVDAVVAPDITGTSDADTVEIAPVEDFANYADLPIDSVVPDGAGADGFFQGRDSSGAVATDMTMGDVGAQDEGPQVGGCTVFPADDAWNQVVSGRAVDPEWTAKFQALIGDIYAHPDYGNWESEQYGIPINVVPATQPFLPVTFDWWPEESDPGPYPFPPPEVALIEGGTPYECAGDCHVLVVQQEICELFEGYACRYERGWHCGNGARWDLTKPSVGQRTIGWTSADAAGLAILPGLVRYDEVRAGVIRHALRFTVECTRPEYVSPATHYAVPDGCDPNAPNSPPMGLRIRLKADYDISGLSPSARVVAIAMQTYGLILADNGSNLFFTGERHAGWVDDDTEPLKTIPANAFEVIEGDE